MKTTSTSISGKIFHFVFTFLTSAGLGYSLVNCFMLNKPNKDLLLVMTCLFFASMALSQRKKWNKQ